MAAIAGILLASPSITAQESRAAEIPVAKSLTTPLKAAKVFSEWPFDAAEAARRQKETAATLGLPPEVQLTLSSNQSMVFALIPAGEFMMGSPDKEPLRGNTEFQHRVRITKAFYLGKTVLTQAQWNSLMDVNPSLFKNKPDSPTRPVEHTSFDKIVNEFLPKLQSSAPKGWTVRLPTEAEWEYACRAGTATAYFFGDTISQAQANYDGTRQNEGGTETAKRYETTAVGSYPANAWGLFDMSGNVFQWCQDWYRDFYRKCPTDDPLNGAPGQMRVLRGGCWIHGPKYCRSASRYFAPPEYLAGSIGSRFVLACP